MAELKGTFYGVSVGPGDPELLTLQAVRLIRKCPVLAAPQTSSGQMLALDIARSALGEALDGKTIVPLHFAMSRDPAVMAASHKAAVQAVRPYLDAGQDTAMLNLGDVSIYATFGYLQRLLEAEGYPTAMAAGVPSFCAAAARLNVPLTGGMDAPLTIAPGSWAGRVLDTPGTKVLMKTGSCPLCWLRWNRLAGLKTAPLCATAACRMNRSARTFPAGSRRSSRAILPPFW